MVKSASQKKFFFTVDVDYVRGSQSGVTSLVDFCRARSLHGTFFVTGRFAEIYPGTIRSIVDSGFDVGTHGWDHPENPADDYRLRSYEEQQETIRLSTQAVEKACGVRPTLFRAPNLWISETTLKILSEEGYTLDSSVPARRLVGRIRSLRYLFAPLDPYYPDPKNLGRWGNSRILEVPPSAFGLAINMSALRMFRMRGLCFPLRAVEWMSSTLVFYTHPAEMVDAGTIEWSHKPPRRHVEGIGPHNYELLGDFTDYVLGRGYESHSLSSLVR